jgi:hypothetical protein
MIKPRIGGPAKKPAFGSAHWSKSQIANACPSWCRSYRYSDLLPACGRPSALRERDLHRVHRPAVSRLCSACSPRVAPSRMTKLLDPFFGVVAHAKAATSMSPSSTRTQSAQVRLRSVHRSSCCCGPIVQQRRAGQRQPPVSMIIW